MNYITVNLTLRLFYILVFSTFTFASVSAFDIKPRTISGKGNDLKIIVDSYKKAYFDPDIKDIELLVFFSEEIKNKYIDEKRQGFRFLRGLLPAFMNAPIEVSNPESIVERNCVDVFFNDVDNSARCLVVTGKDTANIRKNFVLVFIPSNDTYKLHRFGTFSE